MITLVSILFIGNLFFSIQQPSDKTNNEPVRFVLATWDSPDEYGQGIDGFRIYENSTSSWVPAWFSFGYYVEHDDSEHEVFIWNGSLCMMLRVWSQINATLTGAADADEGRNYFRHNITVTNQADTTVFEQQNFTYVDGVEGWLHEPFDDLLYYEHTIILNFLPVFGESYTVVMLLEVFW